MIYFVGPNRTEKCSGEAVQEDVPNEWSKFLFSNYIFILRNPFFNFVPRYLVGLYYPSMQLSLIHTDFATLILSGQAAFHKKCSEINF